MTVRVEGRTIHLESRCRLEDAERLLALLLEYPQFSVDIASATTMHTAIAQILLAAKPHVVGRSANPFLSRFVFPLVENEAQLPADGA